MPVPPLSRRTVRRRWLLAWAGAAALASANGAARELLLRRRLDDLAAHQASTASLAALLAGYFWQLQRQWPIPGRRTALGIGGAWLGLTLAFELGLGRAVEGKSWETLLEDYDLAEGRLWPLLLGWIALGPLAVRELNERATRRSGAAAAALRPA